MKKLLCLVLVGALLLTGCSKSEPQGDEETSTTEQTTEKAIITTDAPITDLLKLSSNRLDELCLNFRYNDRTVFSGCVGSKNVLSSNQFEFESNFLRQSSGTLYVKSIDPELYESGLSDNVKAEEFNYDCKTFPSAYRIEAENPIVTLNDDMSLNDITYSYGLYGLSLNCFVKKTDDGKLELIIDPAYMQGIPMCSDEKASYDFEVDGNAFKADSVSAVAKCPSDIEPEKDCYAKVSFILNYNYSLYGGNASTAEIIGVEILTDDIAGVLSDKYSMIDGEDKDPAMTATYNALSSGLAELKTDKTVGVVLLDLDFNGTPEVIISNLIDDGDEDIYNDKINADIYRIDGEKLIYVDTLYNYCMQIYDTGNYIGFKRLDNGSRAWFQVSYIDRATGETLESKGELGGRNDIDYLFTFDGEKLHFTEAIRADEIENPENPDIDMDIYLMGEKQNITVKYDYNPHYSSDSEEWKDAKPDYPYLSCNGIKATFGSWELLGFIKQEFCKDMEDSSYILNSNWLADTSPYGYMQKNITDRMQSYSLASLVDAYYLGNYNPALRTYEYNFLGGYAKPVIYLYPEEETKVSVSVDFKDKDGKITCSYPEYKDGWTVTAEPDGTIYDENGDEYYCLYWEGKGSANLDISKGFCVKGGDTASFLREKLTAMGFTAREANEMIIYWLPLMQDNAYNIITLHTDDYADAVALNVNPKPDSVIRVFMTFYASDLPVEIEPQALPTYLRSGFTVVEWGGAEITVE